MYFFLLLFGYISQSKSINVPPYIEISNLYYISYH